MCVFLAACLCVCFSVCLSSWLSVCLPLCPSGFIHKCNSPLIFLLSLFIFYLSMYMTDFLSYLLTLYVWRTMCIVYACVCLRLHVIRHIYIYVCTHVRFPFRIPSLPAVVHGRWIRLWGVKPAKDSQSYAFYITPTPPTLPPLFFFFPPYFPTSDIPPPPPSRWISHVKVNFIPPAKKFHQPKKKN